MIKSCSIILLFKILMGVSKLQIMNQDLGLGDVTLTQYQEILIHLLLQQLMKQYY